MLHFPHAQLIYIILQSKLSIIQPVLTATYGKNGKWPQLSVSKLLSKTKKKNVQNLYLVYLFLN